MRRCPAVLVCMKGIDTDSITCNVLYSRWRLRPWQPAREYPDCTTFGARSTANMARRRTELSASTYNHRATARIGAHSATLRLSSMLGSTRRVAFCDVSKLFSTCIVSHSVRLLRALSIIVGPFLVVADRCSVHCPSLIGSCYYSYQFFYYHYYYY